MSSLTLRPLRARRLDVAWLLFAAAFLAYLFVDYASHSSLRIDGVRYFWLDDDMTISMRYARNLAHGLGLVWNPGERVEGYTNFGWTLVMAVVHLFPIPDAKTALYVRGISFVCSVGTLVLARDIVRVFDERPWSAAVPVTLACVVTCVDVVSWAVDGFETALVTVVHLWVVSRLLQRRTAGWSVLGTLAILPIIRGDGLHVWLGDALLIVAVARPNRRLLVWLAATLLPFTAHLLFRRAYYGAWLPNTYYLKVFGLDHTTARGWSYVSHFVERYWLAILFATATAATLLRSDHRALSLATTLVPPMLYAVSVGGDNFTPFRFFAHTMPEVFLFASLGAGKLVSELAGRGAWLGALAGFSLPWHDVVAQIAPVPTNGDPYDQLVVAAILRKNALPDSSVAVIPAGFVPYFSHLRAYDLLGKNDPHVARLPYHPNSWIGHGKVDPEYTFGEKPDFFVSCRPHAFAASLPRMPPPRPEDSFDYVRALLDSPIFRRDYFPYSVPSDYLQKQSAVYVQSASPERSRVDEWQGVVLAE